MRKRGFTLIELLVVISIIGLLSSVVLASLNSARVKARDTTRLAEIRTLQTALEQYYQVNGSYPNSGPCSATVPDSSWCNSVQDYVNGVWIPALVPYLPTQPRDPAPDATANWSVHNGGTYFYYSGSATRGCAANQYYILVVGFENRPDLMSNDTFRWCDGTIYTPGYSVGVSVD